MYKTFTAADYKKHFGLAEDYVVDGFMVCGTYRHLPYEQFEESLNRLGYEYTKTKFDNEFLDPILDIQVNGKRIWFIVAYGGALLSEYMHLACTFGSKKNLLLGTCGGLKKGMSALDAIIPDSSFAIESSAKAYQPHANNKYSSNKELSDKIAGKLSSEYKVYRGETVTYQAMLAETWEDVKNWSEQGYAGVEMEAATVFAISNYFEIPSAAIIRVGDNLIEEETVMDVNYENTKTTLRQIVQDDFDLMVKELVG